MSPRVRSGVPLPANPCLEQQRKRARELLRAHRAGDATATRRLRQHHPRLAEAPETEVAASPLRLHDAQLVIAREYGFPSWPRLKRHIEETTARQHAFVRELSYYEDRAAGLVSVHQGGLPDALAIIRERHPRFRDRADEEIRAAEFGLDDARLVYAREHGFESWDAFTAHVAALARGEKREPFMEAFEAIKADDAARLEALLRANPALACARGTNGNTLLNLAVSLVWKEDRCRAPQERPADRLHLVRLLLAAGADVNAANDRGWTPLHQAGYGNDPEVAAFLLASGAQVDRSAHGDGGTPLAMALFWGHREAAETLAAHGVAPQNLRTAAGLGRLDLVRTFFTPDGRLKPEAGARRDFYRPHSGFPVWRPSNDSREILDEALVWASKSNRVEALPFLAERGADPNGDPYRGTPLTWAAATGRLEAARWLLEHGADVNRRGTFGGPSHGQGVTALHLAAQSGNREMCDLLLEHGADPELRDEIYDSPAHGWAGHFGHTEVRDELLRRSGGAGA